MEIIPSFSRRLFVLILFFSLLLVVAVQAGFHFGIDAIQEQVSLLQRSETGVKETRMIADQLSAMLDDMKFYLTPVSLLVFGVFACLLWIFLRMHVAKLLRTAGPKEKAKKPQAADKVLSDTAEKKNRDRKLFLYLLSLLQRDGRLLDFFFENLELYEDAQIGAAVRNIHENCRNVIKKNLSPRPVIAKDEGEKISIQPGFDSASITLTGNVTGEPPFQGILRHKGWQAHKLELPTLSPAGDSTIISPAEIEIV